MFTGPVGPVEVFFYWPEAVFGKFYWPGAIGSPLASSPVNTTLSPNLKEKKECIIIPGQILEIENLKIHIGHHHSV